MVSAKKQNKQPEQSLVNQVLTVKMLMSIKGGVEDETGGGVGK